MGCWNGTCGVSQLPIHHGEKVRLFFLVPNNYKEHPNTMVHSTALYEPGWYPIRAEYNDYGSVENIVDDWNSRFVHEALKTRAVVPTEDDLESLIDQMERGTFQILTQRFNISSNSPAPHVPSLFMVREGIYTKLANTSDEDAWYMPTTTEGWDALIEETMELLVPPPPLPPCVDSVYTEADKSMVLFLRHFRLFNPDHRLLSKPGMYFDLGYRDLLMNATPADQRIMLQLYAEHIRFSNAMSCLRKTWIAQSGQGSQQSVEILHAVMAMAYQSEMDAINAYFTDDVDGEE
jgi:hypothetical protein